MPWRPRLWCETRVVWRCFQFGFDAKCQPQRNPKDATSWNMWIATCIHPNLPLHWLPTSCVRKLLTKDDDMKPQRWPWPDHSVAIMVSRCANSSCKPYTRLGGGTLRKWTETTTLKPINTRQPTVDVQCCTLFLLCVNGSIRCEKWFNYRNSTVLGDI